MDDLKPIQDIIKKIIKLTKEDYFSVESEIDQDGCFYHIKWDNNEIVFTNSIFIPFDFADFEDKEKKIHDEIKTLIDRTDKLMEI